MATRYGLDDPEIETRWGRYIPYPSIPAMRPTQPPIQWVPGLSRGDSGRGMALTTHPHLAPPFGPSRPVLGWTFTSYPLTGINPLTPNDHYSGRATPLTSKRCILYIYSTNIGTECFKHGIYSPSFSLQNAVCFIILTYLVPVLFTFYIQDVLKLKKNNSGAKRLILHLQCKYCIHCNH